MNIFTKFTILIIAVAVIFSGAVLYFSKQRSDDFSPQILNTKNTRMKISSPEFENNKNIPPKFTCDGENINPVLRFFDVPAGAKSLALIMHDPDAPRAGGFTHWVVWNINPSLAGFEENSAPEGAMQGPNGAGKNSYVGPCPPSGTHRYFFKLYALDTILEIDPSSDKTDLEKAIEGHILEQTELVGLYKRQ